MDRQGYEEAKKLIITPDAPDPVKQTAPGGPEVAWDRPAPSGPPGGIPRSIPPHLSKLVGFFKGIIADESLVLDLCFERAMEIVESNVTGKMYGIDFFASEQGAAAVTHPAHYAAIASPLSIKLYEEVLKAINARANEYEPLYKEAIAEMVGQKSS